MEQSRRGFGAQTLGNLVAVSRRLADIGFVVMVLVMEEHLVATATSSPPQCCQSHGPDFSEVVCGC